MNGPSGPRVPGQLHTRVRDSAQVSESNTPGWADATAGTPQDSPAAVTSVAATRTVRRARVVVLADMAGASRVVPGSPGEVTTRAEHGCGGAAFRLWSGDEARPTRFPPAYRSALHGPRRR